MAIGLMASRRIMSHVFRRTQLLVIFVLGLCTHVSHAMPSGNPIYPLIQNHESIANPFGNLLDVCGNEFFFSVSDRLSFGFYGDYIFSDNARVWDVPLVQNVTTSGVGTTPETTAKEKTMDFNVINANANVSGVFASLAIPSEGDSCFPLLDISLTLRFGGMNTYYRLPLNAFRDMTSSDTAVTAPLPDGLIELQTNYGFVWEMGAQKIIWKDGESFCGVSLDYRSASCPIRAVIVQSQSNPEVYIGDSSGNCRYQEWGLNLGLATYLNDYVLPYFSIGVVNAVRKTPQNCFKTLESQFTNFKFLVRDISSYDRFNLCCGVTFCIADNFYYNIEGRWGCQKACSVLAGLQF